MASKVHHFLLHLLRVKPLLRVDSLQTKRKKCFIIASRTANHSVRLCQEDCRFPSRSRHWEDNEKHLFVGSHDEMSPFLHRLGSADLSVGDVGGDEAEQAVLEDFRAIIHIVLLRGQLCQVLLL